MPNNINRDSIRNRPPVITVMGHVDHGKSTLLDYIRKTNIVAGEAGGITQKIAAYEVVRKDNEGKDRVMTFIDTPGHSAFCSMRKCGAKVADIAILVVSAEDGVKPQTIEAFKTIRDSGTSFMVAINKIDKPEANIEMTKQTLAENEIYVEGYGGTVPWVAISSKTGQGIDELFDMLILTADLADLKGDISKTAEGCVLESSKDGRKGTGATLIIKNGTWKKGMCIVAGEKFSPARMVENFLGKSVTELSFSSPIRVYGFDDLPSAGCDFKAFDNKKDAEKYIDELKSKKVKCAGKKCEENVLDEETVPIIIKADTAGSLEAIIHELAKIKTDRIKLKIILSDVGEIVENDIKTASGDPRTVIAGFNVLPDAKARSYAERLNIQVVTFDIIYKLAEWIEDILKNRQPKIQVMEVGGMVKVLRVFSKTKDKYIMGGRVESGAITTGAEFKILRREAEIGSGKIKGLQMQKKDVDEVKEINEFGGNVQCSVEIVPGDKLQIFTMVTK